MSELRDMKKVLILEDNPLTRKLVEEIARDLEMKTEVFAFDNVKDAYACALERNIDCFIVDIILDSKVPGDTSGLRFVQSIREMKHYILTPVIMLTSLEDAKLYTYEQLHCYRFMEKPFKPTELKKVLEECLGYRERKTTKTLTYHIDGVIMAADVCDIVYVEVSRRILQIHTRKYGILSVPYKTIKSFLEEADSEDMIQCSKHCVVNRNYIEYFDSVNRVIRLRDEFGDIEVGKKYRADVEEGMKRCW